MAVDQPFPSGTFKVGLGPGSHDVSVIFKPTQSTIVFSHNHHQHERTASCQW